MITNNNNEIQNTAQKLQRELSNEAFILPIYVRFRTKEKTLLIPVRRLHIDVNTLTIYDGQISPVPYCLDWKEINNIEALSDFNRKPVFLTDFETQSLKKRLQSKIYLVCH